MRRLYNARLDTGEVAKVLRLQDLRQPIHIALGAYESATEEELHDHIADLNAELQRRGELASP